MGRRGPAAHRPGAELRRHHPRPCPPEGGRGRHRRGCGRHVLRRADGARDEAGRGDRRAGAELRAGALRQQRHRGDDDRAPAGPRRHRAAEGRQVRRQLPRPRRRAARRRRQRRGHARPVRVGGGDGRCGQPDRRRAVQRGARARRRRGLRHRRAGRRQHGPGRTGAEVPRGAAGRLRRGRRAPRLRRGDHRFPPGPRRRAGARTASSPTSPASARSSAAGCPSVPSEVAPR